MDNFGQPRDVTPLPCHNATSLHNAIEYICPNFPSPAQRQATRAEQGSDCNRENAQAEIGCLPHVPSIDVAPYLRLRSSAGSLHDLVTSNRPLPTAIHPRPADYLALAMMVPGGIKGGMDPMNAGKFLLYGGAIVCAADAFDLANYNLSPRDQALKGFLIATDLGVSLGGALLMSRACSPGLALGISLGSGAIGTATRLLVRPDYA